jgi:hypothetical protein
MITRRAWNRSSGRWVRDWWRYGACTLCGAVPGDPCWNRRSLPRYHEPVDFVHKGRLELKRITHWALRLVRPQCPAVNAVHQVRCQIGVHLAEAYHEAWISPVSTRPVLWIDPRVGRLRCKRDGGVR